MIKTKELTDYIYAYKKRNAAEHDTCNSFLETMKACENSFFSRANYMPGHITASSFVITPKGDFLLLIFHKTLQRWLQPGGHIEHEDTSLENAAARELLEETNIAPPFHCLGLLDLDIHTIPKKKEQPEHLHFDMRFLFVSDKKTIKAGSDASNAKWVSVAKLTPENSDESILRALRKTPKLLK